MTRTKLNKTKIGNGKPKKEIISGGLGDKKPDSAFSQEQLSAGIKVEMEHTDNPKIAKEIAKDHLTENADYYKKLEKIENKLSMEQQENADTLGIDAEEFKELEKEIGEISSVDERDGRYVIESENGEFEATDSEDDAEQLALDQLREDLENEPELFTPSWLEGYIDIDNLRDQLEDEVSNSNRDYVDEIETEMTMNTQTG